jgi:hypothetical protein
MITFNSPGTLFTGRTKVSAQDFRDPTVISLILVNLVTMAMAIFYHWQVGNLIFLYWLQSIIIGILLFSSFFSLH